MKVSLAVCCGLFVFVSSVYADGIWIDGVHMGDSVSGYSEEVNRNTVLPEAVEVEQVQNGRQRLVIIPLPPTTPSETTLQDVQCPGETALTGVCLDKIKAHPQKQ